MFVFRSSDTQIEFIWDLISWIAVAATLLLRNVTNAHPKNIKIMNGLKKAVIPSRIKHIQITFYKEDLFRTVLKLLYIKIANLFLKCILNFKSGIIYRGNVFNILNRFPLLFYLRPSSATINPIYFEYFNVKWE